MLISNLYRRRLVNCYNRVLQIALSAGAIGVALSNNVSAKPGAGTSTTKPSSKPAPASKARIVWKDFQRVPISFITLEGKPEFSASTSSPDGGVYSLLLGTSDLEVGQNTAALNVVAGLAFRVPFESAAGQITSFHSDLRAFCLKDPDARITIIADLGGQTVTKDFPYGTSHNGDFILRIAPPAKVSVRTSPPAYFGNIVILVQRRTSKSYVQVQLDSIDIVPVLHSKSGR